MAHFLRETLEKEVKLKATPKFCLPDLPGRVIPRRVFTSTYFDTKSYSLGRLGITLRRRVERNKSHWQLKLPTHSARLELEIAGTPGSLPIEFRDLLFALLREEEAVPVGKIRTERHGFHVRRDNQSVAEITQDSVALIDGRLTKRRLFEIEIELIDGNYDDLAQLKTTLEKAGAAEGDSRPKIFQALDLDFPEAFPVFDASAPPIDHLRALLQRQVTQILIHDPGTRLGKDPEALHQMRVATRRFRALLRTGHAFLDSEWTNHLRQEVGWLGGVLGTVRDYDVLLIDLRQEVSSLSQQDQKTFQRLLRSLENQRSEARTIMLDALKSPQYLMVLDRLDHAVHFPAIIPSDLTLHEIAAKQFKKLRSCVEALSKNYSDEDLHRVRIRAKWARYAAELAESTVGKPASRFIRQIKKFQDLLGSHQDAVMTEQRLRDLLSSSKSARAGFSVGQIVERLRKRRDGVRDRFSQEWSKLRKRGKDAWAR